MFNIDKMSLLLGKREGKNEKWFQFYQGRAQRIFRRSSFDNGLSDISWFLSPHDSRIHQSTIFRTKSGQRGTS